MKKNLWSLGYCFDLRTQKPCGTRSNQILHLLKATYKREQNRIDLPGMKHKGFRLPGQLSTGFWSKCPATLHHASCTLYTYFLLIFDIWFPLFLLTVAPSKGSTEANLIPVPDEAQQFNTIPKDKQRAGAKCTTESPFCTLIVLCITFPIFFGFCSVICTLQTFSTKANVHSKPWEA